VEKGPLVNATGNPKKVSLWASGDLKKGRKVEGEYGRGIPDDT
jgi:hypothetical protein